MHEPIHVIKPPADPALRNGWDQFIANLVKKGIARPIFPSALISNDQLDRMVDTDKPTLGLGARRAEG